MKNKTLGQQFDYDSQNNDFKPWGMEVNTFCMLMHLSQLAGFIIPIAGLVLPILMWATNKDQSSKVDMQGKNILNWMITLIIASIIGGILTFIFIGFLVLIVIGIASIVFAILGAIKSNEGKMYQYPFAIEFFKV